MVLFIITFKKDGLLTSQIMLEGIGNNAGAQLVAFIVVNGVIVDEKYVISGGGGGFYTSAAVSMPIKKGTVNVYLYGAYRDVSNLNVRVLAGQIE